MTDWTKLLDRLEPPQDGESPVRHRTGTVNAVNTDGTVDLDLGGIVVSDVAVLAGAAVAVGFTVQVVVWRGDLLVLGGLRHTQNGPFFLSETVYFTTSDTFDKADYPGLRSVKVKVQAAGGGGGGTNSSGSGESSAGGGGGGGYAESLIDSDALANSETVTVGSGGAGGGGTPSAGVDGGASSFGAHAAAGGGKGGAAGTQTTASNLAPGGLGGSPTAGEVQIAGSDGGWGLVRGGAFILFNNGGATVLGALAAARNSAVHGADGRNYGGGGAGANGAAANRVGGNGANGIVVVEVFV